MALRHVPERTCVACRTTQPKRALVRIVRATSGAVVVDPTGKLPGRGAYLCRKANCWERGLRKEALARALKATLSRDDRGALEAYASGLAPIPTSGAGDSVTEGS